MVGLLSIRFFSLKGMIFFMPVTKTNNVEHGSRLFIILIGQEHARKRKKKALQLNEKPKPLSVNFSNVWRELAT